MREKQILIRNARFIIGVKQNYDICIRSNADILIEDGKITCIGKECNKPRGTEVIDASNHLIIPGLINGHTHAAMVFLRGSLPDHEFWNWLSRIISIEEKILSPKLIYDASRLACIEMLFSGTIGFIDMYYYPEETIKACSQLGLYVLAGPIPVNDADLQYYISLARNYPRYKPIINVHSLYSVDEESLVKAVKLAKRYELPLNIHVSETRREVYMIKEKTGKWPVEYMSEIGLLGNKTILVHLNWLLSSEIYLLKESGSSVVVCPHSGMRLATAGFAPVYELLREGVKLTVGTDGSSGDRIDVIEEIRQLILLYRHNYWDTRLGVEWVVPRIILNGYKIAGIDGGYVEEGAPANLSLLRIIPYRHEPIVESNALSVLALTNCFHADYTIIDGEIVLGDANRDELLEEASSIAEWIRENISNLIDYREGILGKKH